MEGKLVSDDEIEKLTREIDEKERELTKINREYRSGITNKFIGECYITFNHNEGKQSDGIDGGILVFKCDSFF